MGRKLTIRGMLSDLRKRFTPDQILNRTGIPKKTQTEIMGGRTSGSTYERPLRDSRRRGDHKRGSGTGLKRLPSADDLVELKRLKSNPARWAADPRQFARSLNYRRDLAKARDAAKRRGEKFKTENYDNAVLRLSAERRKLRGRFDPSAGGAMSHYLYTIGQTDRMMAVESL